MARKKATIYDISTATGASASTVASVLNGTWRKRRIAEATATRIQEIATELGYSRNLQASGLRRAQSGIAGMIIPKHDNRFFSSMSETFEAEARARGLTPLVVSTLRDPQEELRTVSTLISHNVDLLFITGATAPDSLAQLCARAGIPHVNVDLPGKSAPSVISDNYWGAYELTRYITARIPVSDDAAVHLIGGIGADHNTRERVRGFHDACTARFGRSTSDWVDTCGYAPEAAEASIRQLYETRGMLPDGVIINSTIAFEGVFRFLKRLPAEELHRVAIGCYDWDPFISYLQFPVAMVRQDGAALISNAFRLIDEEETAASVTLVKPTLIEPERLGHSQ